MKPHMGRERMRESNRGRNDGGNRPDEYGQGHNTRATTTSERLEC